MDECSFLPTKVATSALRNAGHDVIAVAQVPPRADDDAVMNLAVREHRIFITEDKDFGQLVYAASRPAPGIIFIRYSARARDTLPRVVLAWLKSTERSWSAASWCCNPGGFE